MCVNLIFLKYRNIVTKITQFICRLCINKNQFLVYSLFQFGPIRIIKDTNQLINFYDGSDYVI